MSEIDLKTAIESNVIKLGTMEMEAHADRIIVVQDEFVSGYECTGCKGKQRVECEECSGVGSISRLRGTQPDVFVTVKCSACDGKGSVICPQCEGKGGLIVVPEKSESRPTTGTIVSVGDKVWCPECKGVGTIQKPTENAELPYYSMVCLRCNGHGGSRSFKRGDAVIYPSFAGHVYELLAEDIFGREVKVILVILREQEVLAKVSGHLELRRQKKSTAVGTAA